MNANQVSYGKRIMSNIYLESEKKTIKLFILFKKVSDLVDLPIEHLPKIRGIVEIQGRVAQIALPGSCPHSDINHLEASNEDTWEDEIRKTPAPSPFVPVSDLVDFIIEESDRLMKGTIHENDWLFYHDVLSLLTSKDCLDYMRKKYFKGIRCIDRWLLPRNGVNKNTPYDGRCVGNSPEMMPLDNSLNNDLK